MTHIWVSNDAIPGMNIKLRSGNDWSDLGVGAIRITAPVAVQKLSDGGKGRRWWVGEIWWKVREGRKARGEVRRVARCKNRAWDKVKFPWGKSSQSSNTCYLERMHHPISIGMHCNQSKPDKHDLNIAFRKVFFLLGRGLYNVDYKSIFRKVFVWLERYTNTN